MRLVMHGQSRRAVIEEVEIGSRVGDRVTSEDRVRFDVPCLTVGDVNH